MCVCVRMCVQYYLRLILRANYLLLHVRTFYKQRPKEHKGVGSVHASFFSRMSASAFQRFDSCSAVKQKPFGKLIRLSKLFRFFFCCNSMWKVQYSTCSHWKVHKHVSSSPVSDPGPSAGAGAKGGCWLVLLGSLLLRKRGSKHLFCSLWQLQLYVLSREFNFWELAAVAHLECIIFFGMWGHFCRIESGGLEK